MGKKKAFVKKVKKSGLTNADIYNMQVLAQKHERIAKEKAFVYMLAIPLDILANDYWSKTANKRIPEFINKVMSLFDSVDKGIVTHQELLDLIKHYSGIELEVEWDTLREERCKNG